MGFYTDYPKYPTSIFNATDYPDQSDDVDYHYAALDNALKKELQAAITELGTLPKGSFADVKTRLAFPASAFCEISFGRGEGLDTNFTIVKDMWNKVNFADCPYYALTDPGGNYDAVNDYYICPVAGVYEIITRMRIRDNPVGGVQWVQGTETSTGVTALIQLTITGVRQAAISNIRVSYFNANDQIPMYVLSWGTTLFASDGYQVVKLLCPD